MYRRIDLYKPNHVVIDFNVVPSLGPLEVGTLRQRIELIDCTKEIGRLYVISTLEDFEIRKTDRFPTHTETFEYCIEVNQFLKHLVNKAKIESS